MDIKSYIESGMLEAYVIGILPEGEMREVAELAAKHEAIRDELQRIEAAMEATAQAQAIAPTPSLESKLMDQVKGSSPRSKPASSQSSASNSSNLWKILSGALLFATSAAGIWGFNNLQLKNECAEELESIQLSQEQYASDYNKINADLLRIKSDLQVTNSPDYTRLIMAGTPNAPAASSTVYFNTATSELYLAVGSLQELAQNQQYQLWAIIDGAPVDAGVFDLNEDYLIKMSDTQGVVSTFAVTIEPRGGSATPSLETMQVAGNL